MDPPADLRPAVALTPETLVLLNRATLVMHTVRTAIHEMNNVLQMISGSAEMLSGAPDLGPESATRIDAIVRNATRGHAILQSVSDLARRDRAGERTLDVSRLAEQALEMRRYEHHRGGITALLEQHAAGGARVRMDPQHLLQILLNLIINAEQAVAGAPTRELRISISETEDGVEILVTDNGPGVRLGDPLFEAFQSTRRQGCAGLGLAASRVLVALYGGTLDSQETSAGAAFVVRLPLMSAP